MSDSNPFQASSTPVPPSENQPEVEAVLYEMADLLAQTKTWVRFLAVLGFIGTGFMVLMFVISTMADVRVGAPGPMELVIMTPFFLLFCLIPSLLMWNYANQIGSFLKGSSPATFSAAITAQKSFWKYVGILSLIIVVLYGMVFVFGFFIALIG